MIEFPEIERGLKTMPEIKLRFTQALTPEAQQAITTCSGFMGAVSRAMGEEPAIIRSVRRFTACSKEAECTAGVNFVQINNTLTISGKCPLRESNVVPEAKTPK